MRVLVLSQYWRPENGVPQRRWEWLCTELRKRGVWVTAVVPPSREERRVRGRKWWKAQIRLLQPQPIELGPAFERIYRTGFYPDASSLTSRALNQAVISFSSIVTVFAQGIWREQQRPDVIIGTIPALPTAFSAWAVSRILKRPLVIDLRDAWPELLGESKSWNTELGAKSVREQLLGGIPFKFASKLVSWFLVFAFTQADTIIVTSESHALHLKEKLGITTPVTVIRNVFRSKIESGVEPNPKIDRRDEVLRVLYAGTVGRAQGLSNALRAMEIAKSELETEVELVVIGDGAAWNELKKQAEQRSLSVKFEHSIPAEHLASHYKWADTVLVHLADWPVLELAIPSKTYELMEKKLHITLVARGEVARIISKNSAGLVIEPGNPQSLALEWAKLAREKSSIGGSEQAKNWVTKQRAHTETETLDKLVRSWAESHK